MKIVYLCNEINLKSGWGVLNYHTIINSLPFFDEVIVLTLINADNVEVCDYDNLKIFPILCSQTDAMYKLGLICLDKISIRLNINIKNIDIIHVLVEPLLPLVGTFKYSKKVFGIVGTYSDFPFRVGINRFLYRVALKDIDKIVSISEYTKSRFNNRYKQDLHVIPLGVDFNYFRRGESCSTRERSIVFVGHIKPRKGLIYALKAFKNIIKDDEHITFYIIGEVHMSAYTDSCLQFIEENKMNKQVIFLGKVSDQELIRIYKKSICNLLPSVNDGNSFEGFGLIHLEANACGIPSIGSSDCGNESAIVNGKTGFLCKQEDVSSIQESIVTIIKDFDDGGFKKWENECVQHAKNNDWYYYFLQIKTQVYGF